MTPLAEPSPLRDKICVEVLPQTERSSVLVTLTRETPVRRCKVLGVGPDADQGLLGKTVLCNILSAQSFGEHLVSPENAVIAVLED